MLPIPKITWGAAFANTWVFGRPFDSPRSRRETHGTIAEAKSGLRDFWEDRSDDGELWATSRLIPRFGPGGAAVSAWATPSATSVQAALAWMLKNVSRLYPDAAGGAFKPIYLLEYKEELERGGVFYRVSMHIRTSDGSAFTEY